nr:hypothetical protein [Elizabethkingia bruuniana]
MRLLLILLLLFSAYAFSQNFPAFKLMRYDEDYSFLKDSTRSFYNSVKYMPVTKDKKVFLSLGGEARAEFVDFNNEDWGRLGIGSNPFCSKDIVFMQTCILESVSESSDNYAVRGNPGVKMVPA